MKIGDIKHWHQARQRLFWLGWPTTLIRFTGTSLLLCASVAGGLRLAAEREDDMHPAETTGLKQAITACRQMRNGAEQALDAHRAQGDDETAVGSDRHNPAGAADNWLMDSSGRRWIFDKSIDAWRRAP